ncbi:hypothetical protein [Blastococcus sp. SYSU D00820]
MAEQIQRVRRRLRTVDQTCSLCGHRGLDLVESVRKLRGVALLQPWLRDARRYTLCPGCGARAEAPEARHRA